MLLQCIYKILYSLFFQRKQKRTGKGAMGSKPTLAGEYAFQGQTSNLTCGCGQSFSNNSQLFFHQTKFDHFTDYCALCDKKYSSIPKLKRHIESLHAGSEYYCLVCTRKFNRIDNLKAHERMVHGIIKCRSCGAVFNTREDLKKHLFDVHGSRK